MQPIISIVGKSDSGKTTLLEGLIAELKRRGYRVAIIKHTKHEVELDTTNKDTWRFSRAGSELAAISSANCLAVFTKTTHDSSPQELAQAISGDYDLILTEGFKQSSSPKIEVHRQEQGKELVSTPDHLLAVVTDEPLETNVPQFSRNDVPKIADLIENTMLAGENEDDLDLSINGAYLPTHTSFNNLLTRTLIAMVSSVTGTRIDNLRISLRRKR